MGSLVRGVLYCLLWFGSIYSGFLLICCPLLPLIFILPKLYQYLIGIVFSMWEMYPTVLMQLICKTRIILSGAEIDGTERALIIMNHRTRVDWNFFWAGIYYASQPPVHRLKMVLKAPIRKIPGPGWVMQIAGYLYIHRDWMKDQQLMSEQLEYFHDVDDTFQLLVFPEGTDLTKQTIEKSNKYADQNKLPHYTKVLHPKTTGFTFLIKTMRQNKQLDALYDITLAYPKSLPQNEMDLVRGVFPEEVHFHINRYCESEIPLEESTQIQWLKDIWQKKEENLVNFYTPDINRDEFTNNFKIKGSTNRMQFIHNALYLAFFFWTTVQFISLYLFLYSSFFRWYAVFCSLSFIIISAYSEGFHILQIRYYKFFSSAFGLNKFKSI